MLMLLAKDDDSMEAADMSTCLPRALHKRSRTPVLAAVIASGLPSTDEISSTPVANGVQMTVWYGGAQLSRHSGGAEPGTSGR